MAPFFLRGDRTTSDFCETWRLNHAKPETDVRTGLACSFGSEQPGMARLKSLFFRQGLSSRTRRSLHSPRSAVELFVHTPNLPHALCRVGSLWCDWERVSSLSRCQPPRAKGSFARLSVKKPNRTFTGTADPVIVDEVVIHHECLARRRNLSECLRVSKSECETLVDAYTPTIHSHPETADLSAESISG